MHDHDNDNATAQLVQTIIIQLYWCSARERRDWRHSRVSRSTRSRESAEEEQVVRAGFHHHHHYHHHHHAVRDGHGHIGWNGFLLKSKYLLSKILYSFRLSLITFEWPSIWTTVLPGPDFLFGVQHILRGARNAPVWLQHRGHQCPWAGLAQDQDEYWALKFTVPQHWVFIVFICRS